MRRPGVPFRWNVGNPGLPRRLGKVPRWRFPAGLVEPLVRCAASVVRAAGDADLVFVGRSPESIHDLLCGAFEETSWRGRAQLLQLSLRDRTPEALRQERPKALEHLRHYLDHLRLTPRQILERPRPLAFVDLVYNGETFGNLLELLRQETEPERWEALQGRLRWVCLLEQDNPESTTWEPGESAWTAQVPAGGVRCVHIPWELWRYLADEQLKTTVSYTAERWGAPRLSRPPTRRSRFAAARLARSLYRLGERWRPQLAAALGQPPAPEPWLRDLIDELLALGR